MHCRKEKKGRMDYQIELSIQILQYEFLGPIKLSEWGPPMDKVAYIIFYKNKDVFNMIYVGESDKTESRDFFTKNDQFKCWLSYAGKEENLYLSIYPMWESSVSQRRQLIMKVISKYKPVCNENSSQNESTISQAVEPEPEPEPEPESD